VTSEAAPTAPPLAAADDPPSPIGLSRARLADALGEIGEIGRAHV